MSAGTRSIEEIREIFDEVRKDIWPAVALQPGQSVLIQGASSGVGLMALQIAKLKGL